jgi:hypothetical protein
MIHLRRLLFPMVILASMICYGHAYADAAGPTGLARAWDVVVHAMKYTIAGAPLWSVLLFWIALPLVNEALQRWRGVKAQSILQFLSNLVVVIRKSPFGKIPLVTQILAILTVFKTPEPVSLDGAEVVPPRRDRAAAMLPILFGIALGGLLLPGCGGSKAPGYATLTTLVKAAESVKQALPAGCEAAQNHAVDTAKDGPSAQAAVAVIQQRCETTLTATVATRDVAKTARDGMVDSTASDPDWAIAALNAYRNLAGLLKTLGIDAPHVPGVN